jgi:hypothetical protein
VQVIVDHLYFVHTAICTLYNMTHEDLVTSKILSELPADYSARLQTMATRRKITMIELIKEALLKISSEIIPT